jgi:hypothetical protein
MDIAKIVIQQIKQHLNVVAADRQTSKAVPRVEVFRSGGARMRHIGDAPILTFDCWARTDQEAEQLAQDVWSLIGDLRRSRDLDGHGGRIVRIVDTDPIGILPDLLTRTPRYSFARQLFTHQKEWR